MTAIDWLFWLTGALIWALVACFWIWTIGRLMLQKLRPARGHWYGTARQRRALRAADDEARRVLARCDR